ncbi:hypothetical protein CVT25_012357 [Psilocybe cyanescens]|uniref:AB hydrolase-1 domain-containing protein n=1 Tax=Psilocybe cyanescens TaxID=93625 RepID=A0A409W2J1_PSICY|nr:hypothetical protein CVT25_012357 [Psilocybe cyanescens]
MPNNTLNVDEVTFESPQKDKGSQPFKIAAKRYTSELCRTDGVTLVFAHGTGFHKESWEPTLERLMSLQSECPGGRAIREAWSFDAPSHGHSAFLNGKTLSHRMNDVSISEIGAAIVSLVTSPYLEGHRIIAIGHSAGTSAVMYSTKLYHPADIPYEAIVLIEPPMIDRAVFNQNLKDRQSQIGYISKALLKQQSVWSNLEEARAWFKSRPPWNTWNENAFDLFMKHGLKEIIPGGEITPRCTKQQEVYAFTDFEPTFEAMDQIALVCKKVPIHVVFGGVNDMVPRYSQDTVIDATKGREVSSVIRIPGAGHLIVQQFPDKLAEYIFKLLSCGTSASKL